MGKGSDKRRMAKYNATKAAEIEEQAARWEASRTDEDRALDDVYYAVALEMAIAAGEKHRTEQALDLFRGANSGHWGKKPVKRNTEFYRNADKQGFTRRER